MLFFTWKDAVVVTATCVGFLRLSFPLPIPEGALVVFVSNDLGYVLRRSMAAFDLIELEKKLHERLISSITVVEF